MEPHDVRAIGSSGVEPRCCTTLPEEAPNESSAYSTVNDAAGSLRSRGANPTPSPTRTKHDALAKTHPVVERGIAGVGILLSPHQSDFRRLSWLDERSRGTLPLSLEWCRTTRHLQRPSAHPAACLAESSPSACTQSRPFRMSTSRGSLPNPPRNSTRRTLLRCSRTRGCHYANNPRGRRRTVAVLRSEGMTRGRKSSPCSNRSRRSYIPPSGRRRNSRQPVHLELLSRARLPRQK